jgi:hypothetical protein
MGTQQTISLLLFGAFLSLVSWGCVVSPIPEPPTINDERIWIELISTNPDDPQASVDTAIIHGDPGAVTPGGALLRVVNLELTETVREINVEDDGSFSVALSGGPRDMFRLRAFAFDLWSRAVDVLAPDVTGPALPAPLPLRECFHVRSPSQVNLGTVDIGDIAVEVITIENECDDYAFIDDIRLRIGDTPAPVCDEQYARCQFGEPGDETTTSDCYQSYSSCQDQCNEDYDACIAEGRIDECDAEYAICIDERCNSDLQICCEQFFTECQETPYEEPQGFTALYGSLPMTVPSGSNRTIVVTFAPLQPGSAEDALIIDVSLPAEERRTITLTGRGTE